MIKSLVLTCLLLSVVLLPTQAQQTTCKALVLEGGGDLGAYEAGVIQGFVNNLPASEVDWDIFAGISVGSIMSAGMAQYPKGEEQSMVTWVVDLWEQISKEQIYQNWPGGLVQGLLFEPGLYDTSPLRAYLQDKLVKPLARMISLGTTDSNTGDLIRYTESLTNLNDLVEAVVSSAAVPAVFPYQQFQGYTFMDGGVAVMQDSIGAILRCLEIVSDPANITLDMIFIADPAVTQWAQNGGQKTFDVYERQSKIQSFFKAFQEYTITKELYPDVNYRYIVNPSTLLPDSNFPFFFQLNQTMEMINQGNADALACIQQGPACVPSFEKRAYQYLKKQKGVTASGDYSRFTEHSEL